MKNGKTSGKINKKLSNVEHLVDIMFSDAGIAAERMDRMRMWLASPDKEEEKSGALYNKFLEIFKFNPEPELAPQLWPDLARRLGLDETPVAATYDCLAVAGAGGFAGTASVASVDVPATGSADVVETEPEPRNAKVSTEARRKRSFRWTVQRVAAVLVPVAVALGVTLWITGRGPQSTLVEITVPTGTTQTIMLPDGSRVDAEGGATISYDEAAFADNRIVKLTGEALFDVIAATGADGARAPFTVEADRLSVNVLGTVFRLAGVENGTEAVAVSLYDGSVGVTIDPEVETGAAQETEILAAGERLRVNTLTGEHAMELIPASEMAQRGFTPLLRFDEATLADLVLALELNHGVSFDLTQDIDHTRGRYTANFEGATLDEVLEMLSKIDTSLSFERSGDRVNVRLK